MAEVANNVQEPAEPEATSPEKGPDRFDQKLQEQDRGLQEQSKGEAVAG